MLDHLLGLRREADQQARALLAGAELGQDVARRHELELGRAVAFLELGRRRLDAPVGDRRDEDRGVGGQ